jgi:GT2 family glycosyltransferase
MSTEPVIGIVPVSVRDADDLERIARCLVSARATAPQLPLLLAETGWSDPEASEAVVAAAEDLGLVHVPFSGEQPSIGAGVAAGMRVALDLETAAVVIDPDVEFEAAGWLERLLARTDTAGRPAAIVGARTVYPGGIVDQAGMYFSLFDRLMHLRYRSAPAALPAALAPARCPVAAGVVLIRLQTMKTIGLYDEGFLVQHAEVAYCLRAFEAGLDCIVEPAAEAVRLLAPGTEPEFPAVALLENGRHYAAQHRDKDMSPWIPAVL